MGSLGWPEILLILVVALIIFGPRKLPELGKTLGESLAQFRRASEDFKRTWEAEVEYEKARIDTPKPAETSYSYGHDGSTATSESTAAASESSAATAESSPAASVEPAQAAEPPVPTTPPEGTVPAHDTTLHTSAPEPASVQPVSAQTKRDWM